MPPLAERRRRPVSSPRSLRPRTRRLRRNPRASKSSLSQKRQRRSRNPSLPSRKRSPSRPSKNPSLHLPRRIPSPRRPSRLHLAAVRSAAYVTLLYAQILCTNSLAGQDEPHAPPHRRALEAVAEHRRLPDHLQRSRHVLHHGVPQALQG